MGRIKSTLIKRTGEGLLREENNFEEDFNKNKSLLRGHLPSKSTRNKIAGYISRLKTREREKRAIMDSTTNSISVKA